jgi:beta-lactamase class A
MTAISRRILLAAAAVTAVAPAAAKPMIDLDKRALVNLERKSGGRLGVCILATATKRRLTHRADERFAMCSTFKLPLAAAIFRLADQGRLNLDTLVPYTKDDIVFHAPVTEPNLAKGGMTIRDLAEAAQKQSDNVAANLLLKQLGGPVGFTQFFREIGDQTTRIDRFEPDMNDVKPGDERDTTTPTAMAETLRKILVLDVLKPASRELLFQWMVDTTTGAKRLRAGLPPTWRVGDKTGSYLGDEGGKVNDVAMATPPNRPALIITAYLNTATPSETIRDEDQAILAKVGRIAADWAA